MKISKRLKQIASFVDDNSYCIDVGCDHALLDIFLVLNKNNIKMIASDINPNPLKIAKKNILRYGVDNLIEVKLGSGLEPLNDMVDTIIISGLGGKTIIDIISQSINKLKKIKTIILSPHGDEYEVRKYLIGHDFKIIEEAITLDNSKFYTIIKFVCGRKKYSEDELFFGPCLLTSKDENFYHYYQNRIQELKIILNKIPDVDNNIKTEIIKKIERLDRIIKV